MKNSNATRTTGFGFLILMGILLFGACIPQATETLQQAKNCLVTSVPFGILGITFLIAAKIEESYKFCFCSK
jgi:hypothetical protein